MTAVSWSVLSLLIVVAIRNFKRREIYTKPFTECLLEALIPSKPSPKDPNAIPLILKKSDLKKGWVEDELEED